MPEPLQQALVALANRQSLSESLAATVFAVVMRGEASPVQIAALLVGLRVKGETAEEAAGAARVLREARLAFLFAPNFHPAMRHVGPVRRELGVPSIMNLLGPLANPAGATRQVVGVADRDRAPLLAAALARLGAEHALVVHGRVGMDEIAPTGVTDVWEVQGGAVRTWELDPADHGLAVADPAALRGGDPPANAPRVRGSLGCGGGGAPGLGAAVLHA